MADAVDNLTRKMHTTETWQLAVSTDVHGCWVSYRQGSQQEVVGRHKTERVHGKVAGLQRRFGSEHPNGNMF
eukprot:313899-Hanusia_phi.AAC.1